MSEINFPNNPSVGTSFTSDINNVTYKFDGVKWDVVFDDDTVIQHWARNATKKTLNPINPDDYVDSLGYSFERIPELP